jgi:hypothetical protein
VIERIRGLDGGLTAWRAGWLFAALTIILTWPQILQLGSVPDNKDSYFNLWRLAWIAHQLPRSPLHLFDANIFAPLPLTLAFSDAILLEGLLGAPWLWAGIPVVYVSNLLVLGSFVACGLGAFLLVRELTADAASACVAGLIFAFAPYRFDHYYHLELLWAQWLPLTLWMLHRALKSGRTAHALWAGCFFALQGLSCIYYAVFFAIVLAGLVPVLVAAAPGPARKRATASLLAGALLAAAILAPYMLPYRAARQVVGDRDEGSIRVYSAGPAHYLAALPGSVIYGGITGPLGSPEKRLFMGFAAMGLAAIALLPPFDRRRVAYALALAIAVDGTLGHRGVLFPWLRDHVDLFRGLRVPARFGHLVLLGTSVLAGFGLARLRQFLARRRPPLAGAATAAVGFLVVLEYLMWPMALVPVQTAPDNVSLWLRSKPPGVVADLPLPRSTADIENDAKAAYRSTFNWRPLLNGYSGFYPSSYVELWAPVASFPDEASLTALHRRGVAYLVVRQAGFGAERYDAIVDRLALRCDVGSAGPFPDGATMAMIYTFVPRAKDCGASPRDLSGATGSGDNVTRR